MGALKRKRGGQVLAVSLGRFVQRIRKSRKIEQGELAKKLGISQASLSRIEAGNSEITFSRMLEVCVILDLSIESKIDSIGFFIYESGRENMSEGFYFDGVPF